MSFDSHCVMGPWESDDHTVGGTYLRDYHADYDYGASDSAQQAHCHFRAKIIFFFSDQFFYVIYRYNLIYCKVKKHIQQGDTADGDNK